MRRWGRYLFSLAVVGGIISCPSLFAREEDWSSLLKLGGDTSVILAQPTSLAFAHPAQNLNPLEITRHLEGDSLFERKYSNDPSARYRGLGPAFNNHSCIACHVLDGRGAFPVMNSDGSWTKIGQNSAVFLRVSNEDETAPPPRFGGSPGVPGFGSQIFQAGVFGLREDFPGTGQADVYVKFESSSFTYPDGSSKNLRKPIFKIENPYDGPNSALFGKDVRFSPRMTPPMVGLGLLEAIREEDILALAARDLSSLGIHGHANYVYDLRKDLAGEANPVSLGRFGLKASTPSVYQQTLAALSNDMGITTTALPLENIWNTPLFENFKSKWIPGVEMPAEISETLIFYARTLAVPSRREITRVEVQTGARLFQRVGCAACHQPSFTTGPSDLPALSGQIIYPFTDMLLHDMGEGLADGRKDYLATGREWKTRALWGIGVTPVVNSRGGYLHDGRARTVEEAILWHEGEALLVRNRFANLSLEDRLALLEFLKSL